MAPMAIAPSGLTAPPDGVMATRPATAPEAAPRVVKAPWRIFSYASQASMAAAVATWVLTNITAPTPSSLPSPEPALKPNQPNHSRRGAEHDQRQAVRPHRVLLEADALADDEDHAEGRGTGVDVDGGTAGEVDDAQLEEPAAGAPDPVGDREVDDGDPQGDEQRPGAELHAVGERTADQGGGDDREHQLEDGEDVDRDGVAVPAAR